MGRIELVVFDIAGTTVADSGNINQAFRDAFASEGFTVNEDEVNKLMGYRKIEAISIVVNRYAPELGNEADAVIHRIHDLFNSSMVEFYTHDKDLKPLPFAEELFRLLHAEKIKVALNTGFTRQITDAILKRLSWNESPLIDAVICSDEVEEGRPHPYMIQYLMKKLGITHAEHVAKVGDTEVDVLEGRNAGCGLVVAVTTGAYTRAQLENDHPDYIIDSLQELPVIIQ